MLTEAELRALKPREKPYKKFDGEGLYIEVAPDGAKRWRLKYRFAGKEPRLALGVYPAISLKEARRRKAKNRALLENGIDPGQERRAERLRKKTLAADSFGPIAEEWYRQENPHWSRSHADRVKRAIDRDLARLKIRPIAEITAPELLAELRKVEARGAIETAHRVKQVAGQVFRYAVAAGKAERDPSRDLQGALAKPHKTHLAAVTKPGEVGDLDLPRFSGRFTVWMKLYGSFLSSSLSDLYRSRT